MGNDRWKLGSKIKNEDTRNGKKKKKEGSRGKYKSIFFS